MDNAQLAKILVEGVEKIVDRKLKEFKASLVDEVTGKVVTTSPLTVFLGTSEVAVSVNNPRGFTLSVGNLVRVRFPNFKNDANRYIDRVL